MSVVTTTSRSSLPHFTGHCHLEPIRVVNGSSLYWSVVPVSEVMFLPNTTLHPEMLQVMEGMLSHLTIKWFEIKVEVLRALLS